MENANGETTAEKGLHQVSHVDSSNDHNNSINSLEMDETKSTDTQYKDYNTSMNSRLSYSNEDTRHDSYYSRFASGMCSRSSILLENIGNNVFSIFCIFYYLQYYFDDGGLCF